MQVLNGLGLLSLGNKKVLDVGCGSGGLLLDFETWGARRENLAGIDLSRSRIKRAQTRLCAPPKTTVPGADIRVGNAVRLPWPDQTFDIVYQGLVFSSILDTDMRRRVASEILRVVKKAGVILWYDFFFNNPRNPHVRGIRAQEIRSLFSSCNVTLKRITLAPPIARIIVPITWIGALSLEKLSFLNTHYLGVASTKQ